MPTLNARDKVTLTVQESQALSVTGSTGAVGVVYQLDEALGGGNSKQSWTVGAGALAAIGPFAGTTRFLLTCSAGTITATIAAAVLSASASSSVSGAMATISGDYKVGSTLTAAPTTGYSFTAGQWKRAGVAISGETALTYKQVTADIGCLLSFTPTSPVYTAPGGITLPATAVTATAQENTFGDSFTVGVGATTPTTGGWAYLYATARGLPILNTAVAGTVMQNRIDSTGAVRASNGLSRYQSALITGSSLSTEYAILYGFNDARYTGAPATINVTNFITDYRTVLTGMIAAGIPASAIKIGSPGYITDTGLNTGSTGFTGQTRAGFEAYVSAVQQLAGEFGVTYVPVYEYMRDNGGASLISADLIHPNDAGHIIIKNIFVNPALYVAPASPASDTTAPASPTAAVANATPTTLSITFNEALATGYVPAATDFASSSHTISAVAISGPTVNLTVSAYVNGEAASTVSYTRPATNGLRDASGNLVASFSGLAVTNNVAGVSAYPQIVAGFSGMTESGAGPYTYAGSGAAALGSSTVYGGILNQSLQSGVDGSFSVHVTVRPTTKTAFIGLQTTNTMGLASAIPYTLYASASSNNYVAVSSGTAQTVAATVAAAVGDVLRLRRTGTSIVGEVSKDSGSTWTTIYTWTSAPTTQLYYSLLLTGTAAVDALTTVGLA